MSVDDLLVPGIFYPIFSQLSPEQVDEIKSNYTVSITENDRTGLVTATLQHQSHRSGALNYCEIKHYSMSYQKHKPYYIEYRIRSYATEEEGDEHDVLPYLAQYLGKNAPELRRSKRTRQGMDAPLKVLRQIHERLTILEDKLGYL
jgi:hypothetical protein